MEFIPRAAIALDAGAPAVDADAASDARRLAIREIGLGAVAAALGLAGARVVEAATAPAAASLPKAA